MDQTRTGRRFAALTQAGASLLWAASWLGAAGLLGGCMDFGRRAAVDPRQAYVDARTTLFQAMESEDPTTRSHALEVLAETIPQQAGGAFVQALGDPNPTVRFAAVMAIGDSKYAPARSKLRELAADKTKEPDKRVLAAVIHALYRIGDDQYAGALGSLLFDPEKEVRANAAMVMGKMGEPSAIGPLKALLDDEKDPGVQIQAVESLAMLGDSRSATLLEAYTKTPFLDDRLVAIPAMVRARTARAVPALRELTADRQPPIIRVAAAGALATLGYSDEQCYRLCLRAAEDPAKAMEQGWGSPRHKTSEMEMSVIQQLAVRGLGWMRQEAAVDLLHGLLKSGDGAVRTAAAMSILRLLAHWGPRGQAEAAASQAPPKPAPASQPVRRPPPERPKLQSAGGRD